MRRDSMHGNQEIPEVSDEDASDRIGKPEGQKPMMHAPGKSDCPIVPEKQPNNVGRPTAEVVEGRGQAKRNPSQQNTPRTQSRNGVPSALERVRQVARRDKGRSSPLSHTT